MKRKKFLLTLALLCTVAQGVWAQAQVNNEEGLKEVVNGNGDNDNATGYSYLSKSWNETAKEVEVTPLTCSSYTVLDKNRRTLDNGWYVVNSSFTVSDRITVTGNDVNIILCDNCTLTAESGIKVNENARLTIYAQSDDGNKGRLVARTKHNDHAAIGGEKNIRAGTIVIHGGDISARASKHYGAGIGGGYGDGSGVKAITIYGGKVTAHGHDDAAGIGKGKNNNLWEVIRIYGGTIDASSEKYGAGIGGGKNRGNGEIFIYGGTITAKGGKGASGIGGGFDGDLDKPVHIYGGTVTANSEGGDVPGGAGIGAGGWRSQKALIEISGGTVTATGGYEIKQDVKLDSGAGIGGGASGNGGTVNITGGNVRAVADIGGGIGGGYDSSDGGTVNITGGTVTAIAVDGNGLALGTGHSSILGRKYSATITLGNDMTVWAADKEAGTNSESAHVAAQSRVKRSGEAYAVRIAPCEIHTYVYSSVTDQGHVAACKYCKSLDNSTMEEHGFVGESNTCACGYVNGAEKQIVTLAFFSTSTATASGYESSDYNVVKSKEITLPDCPSSCIPTGYEFVGWLQQNDKPASIEASDDETLQQPGQTFTPADGVSFFARYRLLFTEEWDWADDLSAVTLKLTNSTLENQIILQPTVSKTVTTATETTEGSINASATTTYENGNTTYTFSDDRSVPQYYTYELNETDNTTMLSTANGHTGNVQLTGRTLYKDGKWNTLCLPFDLVLADSPFAGATMKEFSSAEFSNGTLTLNFDDATSIEAGKPYLIKWDGDGSSNIESPVFRGVTISNEANNPTGDIDDTKSVTFAGTYEQLSYTTADYGTLYLGSGNTLYYPAPTEAEHPVTIGAQRAYFQLNGLTAGEPTTDSTNPTGNVRSFVMNMDDEVQTTGIISTTDSTDKARTAAGWFDMLGRRLSGKPTAKGLYLNNGKKVIIK